MYRKVFSRSVQHVLMPQDNRDRVLLAKVLHDGCTKSMTPGTWDKTVTGKLQALVYEEGAGKRCSECGANSVTPESWDETATGLHSEHRFPAPSSKLCQI